MMLFLRVNLALETKSNNGKLSIMKQRECTLIFKLSSKKTKHFGLVNLISWRSRKNSIRRTMKISRLCSSKQLTNFSVIVRTLNKSTSITINQLWLSSKLNIKRNCTRFRSNCRFKVTSIKHSSIDLKKITKIFSLVDMELLQKKI